MVYEHFAVGRRYPNHCAFDVACHVDDSEETIKKMSVEKNMLTYHKTTEEEKCFITEWKYPGEYAVYNSVPYEEQKKRGFGFANPANHFYSFYDETKLVGFINLYEEKAEIFFGIGVNPDCCSEGYGQQMTKTACEISKVLFGTKPLYLEVRTWNKRAVSCYQKAGFVIKGEPIRQTTSAGEGVFYHMVQENK